MSNPSQMLETPDTDLWEKVTAQSNSFQGAASWAGCHTKLLATKKCTIIQGHTIDAPDYEVTYERLQKAVEFLRDWADRLDGILTKEKEKTDA